MKVKLTLAVAGVLLVSGVLPSRGRAQTREADIVNSATNVLNELMRIPSQGLPRSMLSKAQGIVIIPGMFKVGFVAGVRHGKGIAVVRNEQGAWNPPTFLTMSGGSVGWQVGVQSTDVLLVFKTRKSVQGLMSGKFTIGVDAAAAAGPVGRQASAGTDVKLGAEILSYNRSRGLFVGAAVDGSVLQINAAANQSYYRAAGMMADGTPFAANAQLPPSASRLLATLAAYSGAPVAAPASPAIAGNAPGTTVLPPAVTPPAMAPAGVVLPVTTPTTPLIIGVYPPTTKPATITSAPGAAVTEIERTRLELAGAAQQLGARLDASWRQYLAIPKGVFSGEGTPTLASLEQATMRFEAVAKDARYRVLRECREFQVAYSLLKTYTTRVRNLSQPAGAIPSANAGQGTSVLPAIR